ncbi:MAG: hypothetical protein LBO62_01465 [Endomicrobium sp.]|jgi:hypothetical protein|nr:hypothetical protein [Endomicrobium sp.]
MKKNIVSLIICAVFILSSMLSLSFIVIEAQHDCTEENCPICLQIEQTINALKQTSQVLFAALAVLFFAASFIFKNPFLQKLHFFRRSTLISLKVIMND